MRHGYERGSFIDRKYRPLIPHTVDYERDDCDDVDIREDDSLDR